MWFQRYDPVCSTSLRFRHKRMSLEAPEYKLLMRHSLQEVSEWEGNLKGNFVIWARKFNGEKELLHSKKQLGNLLSLCREIAGARDILQKFENLKKQHE